MSVEQIRLVVVHRDRWALWETAPGCEASGVEAPGGESPGEGAPGKVSAGSASSLEASVETVVASVRGKRIVVGLGSELCFSGVVNAGGHGQERLYLLEEVLPVAAEEVVAGFVENGSAQGDVLGVAVERAMLREILEKLEGATVAAVCPLALMAVGDVAEGTVVMGEDAVRVKGGKPVEWAWGVGAEGALTEGPGGRSVSEAEARGLALRHAGEILAGRARAVFDLRERAESGLRSRGGLLAMAAVVMLGVLIGSMWVRAWRYGEAIAAAERREAHAYAQVMTGEAPPDRVGRMESELRRLQGNGAALGDLPGTAEERRPMSAVMVEVLGCLPQSVKFEVSEVRVEEGTLSVAGRVGSHREAEAIAAALRSASGFDVGSPGTEQQADGTVRFTLSGTRKSAAQAVSKGEGGP